MNKLKELVDHINEANNTVSLPPELDAIRGRFSGFSPKQGPLIVRLT